MSLLPANIVSCSSSLISRVKSNSSFFHLATCIRRRSLHSLEASVSTTASTLSPFCSIYSPARRNTSLSLFRLRARRSEEPHFDRTLTSILLAQSNPSVSAPRFTRHFVSSSRAHNSTESPMEEQRVTRSKRKPSSQPNGDVRPRKQRRSSLDVPPESKPPGNHVNGTLQDPEPSDDEGSILGLPVAVAETKEWQATIEKVVKNVVSIHFCQTASFDTDPALSSEATGFVVDAERGYILTNRHVVGAGPFWGYCIFDNHEECDVYPVYRDPVHDFGFLRFDPKAIKYMDVTPLTLRPDLAKIGVEIRVVGNDAGEKLSILSGVISRMDRNAPEYGEGFSDFNTNYIQAAASASGGSSGSPVVQIDGHAIALQAGGRSDGAATDYFLPLDRPSRALQCLQEGKPITRGTIQTQWLLKPFDECRRLGLRSESEAEVRKAFPNETNMLVADIILPKGPAHTQVKEGDVLLRVNGELLTSFIKLDDILDSSVEQTVKLLVQRGGKDVEVEIGVMDLHSITPDRFVSVAGGSFHDLSYQQARLYGVECKGVFVCEAAGSFRFDGIDYGWIITSIDNKETPDLKTFIEVMKAIPDRSRVVVTYKHLRDLHTHNTSIILIDRHWASKIKLAVRNDETGLWDFTSLADALPAPKPEPRSANFIEMKGVKHTKAAEIIRSFVRVSCNMPIKIEGYPRSRRVGFGLVVDADKGLVVVSRAFIPYDLCDISVTIADSIIVDAKVLFMHPIQNYVIIQYDPSLVLAPVKSAQLSTETIKQGEETILFGFNQNYRPTIAKTAVTDVTSVAIPASGAVPRYRSINLDAITVDSGLSSQVGTGVLVSEEGVVQALWLTYLGERNSNNKDVEYHLGMAAPMLIPVIQQVQAGVTPRLRILNVECSTTAMSQARIMGLSEEWIARVEKEDPERHQLFMVRKVDCGHTDGLIEGDLILTLNDKVVTRVADLDIMYNLDVLEALVLRKRKEMRLSIKTLATEDLNTDRTVVFCGLVLHRPHHAVRQQISKIPSDVYVANRIRGSPAYMYGLAPTNFIEAVNDVPTPDLSTFLQEANKIPDNTYFRLSLRTFDDVPFVATMKKNEHYFPTMEYIKDEVDGTGEKKWRMCTYGEDGKRREGAETFQDKPDDQGGEMVVD